MFPRMAVLDWSLLIGPFFHNKNNNNKTRHSDRVQHHCGRTRGLVNRRGGSGEGASWEASRRRPQEDAEGMPIRHT